MSRARHVLIAALFTLALIPGLAHGAIIRGHARGGLPAGSRVLGALARTTTVRASVALAPRDPAGLAAYAQAVSTPGSALYHRYLSVRQFAQRFAPSAVQVAAVARSLRHDGLIAGRISANGLALSVSANAGRVESAFSTSLRRFELPDGRIGYANTSEPSVDPSIAPLVQGVVGLDTLAPSAPKPRVLHAHAKRSHDATSSSAGPQACSSARSQADSEQSYTTSDIAARYGLSSLYAAGVQGSHVTVAVYELEPFSAADIAAFQACFQTSAGVSTVAVDGGPGSGSGSGEAAMDIEDVIGLAPHADVRVYEGPASGAGAYDTYARIVSDNVARVVTTSWGLCEADEGSGAAAAEATLFQEAAAQGQTILASSGDSGSDDCANHRQAVDDPASQPWVTGVGASSIHGSSETVWNNGYGATGGGASQLWGRPAYQASAAAPQSSVTCGSAGTACREVPDVTADGDPNSGYVIYYRGHWNTMGGTSVSTPTWAAIIALADSSPACAGRPVGFANPALYRLAGATNFTDVTSGTNAYDHVAGFAAGTGYDMASGLGAPNAGALVPALCGDTLTFAGPAAQRSSVGQSVRLALGASSSSGAAISYTASGLPTGLSISPATGAVSGAATSAGSFTVTVTATDGAGSSARASFAWVVAAATSPTATKATAPVSAPASSRIVLRRLGAHSTRVGRRVRVAVTARSRRGLALRFAARGLPKGLRINRRTGLISGRAAHAGARRVTVQVTDGHGGLAAASFRWRVIPARRHLTR